MDDKKAKKNVIFRTVDLIFHQVKNMNENDVKNTCGDKNDFLV
jgi:hypothetical protein